MTRTDHVLSSYAEAYHKLYKRHPRELHRIDDDWVLVNGVRISTIELDQMTRQLREEYAQSVAKRRGIAARLINWFKSDQ